MVVCVDGKAESEVGSVLRVALLGHRHPCTITTDSECSVLAVFVRGDVSSVLIFLEAMHPFINHPGKPEVVSGHGSVEGADC